MPIGTRLRAPARRLDAIVLANFLALGMIVAAVPRYLHSELGASRFETGLATTIYFVAALAVRPVIGGLVDRIGRRPFILVPPFVLAVLTVGYEGASSVPLVGALRLAAGGVSALFFTSIALAVTDLAPPERRAAALGRQSVMTYTGFTLGPLLADRLIQVGWTPTWLVAAGLHLLTGVAALGLVETHARETDGAPARFGFDRRVLRPGTAFLAANFTFASIVAFLPEYSERVGIDSPGALFATYAMAVVIVRAVSGGLADRIGPDRYLVPALSVGTLGLLLLATTPAPALAFVGVAVVGLGAGSTFPAATASALSKAGDGDRGKAMGTTLALGDIGQATAGPLVGWLSTVLGFGWVYGTPAIVVGAAVLVVLSSPELRRRERPGERSAVGAASEPSGEPSGRPSGRPSGQRSNG